MLADDSTEKLIDAVKQDEVLKVYEILCKNPNMLQDSLIVEFFQNVNSVEMLRLLFRHTEFKRVKSCVNSMYVMSLLTCAIMHGKSIDIIIEIANQGEDINGFDDRQRTPLIESLVCYRDVAFIEKIILMGADVNKCNSYFRPPLHFAYKRDIVALLLKHGADVDHQDDNGQTALLRALELNREKQLVMELIEGGADLRCIDENGNSVLHLTNDVELLEYFLFNNTVSVNRKNKKGQTPLMKCVKEHKSINLIKMFLENGGNPNSVDVNYNTPLHYAYNGEIVNLLVHYGANINAKNKYNHSPFHTIFHHRPIAFSFGFGSAEAILKHTLLHNNSQIPNDTGSSEYMIASNFRLLIEECKKELDKMKEYKIIKDLSFYNFCTFKKTKFMKFINMSESDFLYSKEEMEKLFPNFHVIIQMKIKQNELDVRKYNLCKKLNHICLGSRSFSDELVSDEFKKIVIDDSEECLETENVNSSGDALENNSRRQSSTESPEIVLLDYDSLRYISLYLNYEQLSKLFRASM